LTLSFRFPHKNPVCICFLPCTCHIAHLSHLIFCRKYILSKPQPQHYGLGEQNLQLHCENLQPSKINNLHCENLKTYTNWKLLNILFWFLFEMFVGDWP
jgi:hypothetical protein